MFDSEQYTNHQYYSRHTNSINQSSFLPYMYPSYCSEYSTSSSDIINGKNEHYICKWSDPETNLICNQAFPYMRDIGKKKRFIRIKFIVSLNQNS